MCSIVTGFATLCQLSMNSNYYCSLQKARFDFQYFSFLFICAISASFCFCFYLSESFAQLLKIHTLLDMPVSRPDLKGVGFKKVMTAIAAACHLKGPYSQSFISACLGGKRVLEAVKAQVQFCVLYLSLFCHLLFHLRFKVQSEMYFIL